MAGESADTRRESHQDRAVRATLASVRRTADWNHSARMSGPHPFWTAADLEMKLLDFQRYYNGHRTHAGLDGRPPEPSPDAGCARASVSAYRWRPHCRGLYQ